MKNTGILLILGTAQFILAMIIAESIQPGYSIADNYVSDLGVGNSALLFNGSIFIIGLLISTSACLIFQRFRNKLFSVLLFLGGIGTMGVGVFPETTGSIHLAFALIAFLCGGLSMIASYMIVKKPLSIISIALGVVTLSALILFIARVFLGLGQGGMERLIVYPELIWCIAFGGYLLGLAVPLERKSQRS